jgi:hypothetical protein
LSCLHRVYRKLAPEISSALNLREPDASNRDGAKDRSRRHHADTQRQMSVNERIPGATQALT